MNKAAGAPTAPKPKAAPVKPRVPLGPPLKWSEADLDKLSEITPADIERAKQWGTPGLQALLAAEPEEE